MRSRRGGMYNDALGRSSKGTFVGGFKTSADEEEDTTYGVRGIPRRSSLMINVWEHFELLFKGADEYEGNEEMVCRVRLADGFHLLFPLDRHHILLVINQNQSDGL